MTQSVILILTLLGLLIILSCWWLVYTAGNFWKLQKRALEKARKAETHAELDEAWNLMYKASRYSIGSKTISHLAPIRELLNYKYEQIKKQSERQETTS